jgi:hypothetical protein
MFFSEAELIEIADGHQSGEAIRAIDTAISCFGGGASTGTQRRHPGDTIRSKPTVSPAVRMPTAYQPLDSSRTTRSGQRDCGAPIEPITIQPSATPRIPYGPTGILLPRRSTKRSTGPGACSCGVRNPRRCALATHMRFRRRRR